MKRKRGSKSKHKKPYVKGKELNEDESDADDIGVNSEALSNFQSDGGSPTHGVCEVSSGGHIDTEEVKETISKKAAHGRVWVKLKSSNKIIDAAHTSSGVQGSPAGSMQWDGELNEKIEGGLHESEIVVDMTSKKLGSIKIKSSRGSGTLCRSMPDKCKEKTGEEVNTMERCSEPQYNKKELAVALAVIKKVMKMEAAQPFNSPVDPVELGIPDYFDIIETPMDFGTICNHLESGKKYMNSKDVYKDVLYIWSNCYRYNNKGDYILDLMKRVKKNFAKYWSAAGLYWEVSKKRNSSPMGAIQGGGQKANVHKETNGAKTDGLMLREPVVATPSFEDSPTGSHLLEDERVHLDDCVATSQEKSKVKGTSTKQKGRRLGKNKHKADCLCAVCVARRRRLERDMNAKMLQTQASYVSRQHGLRLQENDNTENQFNHNLDISESSEDDVNADLSVEEFELERAELVEEGSEQGKQDGSNNLPLTGMEIGQEENDAPPLRLPGIDVATQVMQVEELQMQELEESDSRHDNTNMSPETQDDSAGKKRIEGEQQEASRVKYDRRLPEDILSLPSSEVLHMCETLFPTDPRSVWGGPRSLNHHRVESRDSAIRNGHISTILPNTNKGKRNNGEISTTTEWNLSDVNEYETVQPDKIVVNGGEQHLKELNTLFSKHLKKLLSTEAEIDDAALISIDSKGADVRLRQGTEFNIQRMPFHAGYKVETLEEAKAALQKLVNKASKLHLF